MRIQELSASDALRALQSGHEGLTFDEAQRLHYLYERTAADLGRLTTFASEPELTRYLESLMAKAYAELHETRTTTAMPIGSCHRVRASVPCLAAIITIERRPPRISHANLRPALPLIAERSC